MSFSSFIVLSWWCLVIISFDFYFSYYIVDNTVSKMRKRRHKAQKKKSFTQSKPEQMHEITFLYIINHDRNENRKHFQMIKFKKNAKKFFTATKSQKCNSVWNVYHITNHCIWFEYCACVGREFGWHTLTYQWSGPNINEWWCNRLSRKWSINCRSILFYTEVATNTPSAFVFLLVSSKKLH